MSSTAEIQKVACYYHVSSSGQKDRGTLENQRYACRELCAVKGWDIAAEFEDPAVSGTVPIDERPQGQRMIERVKAGEFDAVVAVHLDRLTRSEKMQERGYIYDVFAENHTAFASLSEGVIHCNSLVGDVTFSLRSAIAKDEREKILERQQAGRYRASREGRYSAGQINYGMEWDPVNKEWKVDEAELSTLKEIRRLIRAGVSTTEIARIFNADLEKYPPKYAKIWTDGNVANKSKSDFLFTGDRTFKVGPDQYENIKILKNPFFTKDEVMEVRHLLKQKKRGGPRRPNAERQASFLLAGIGYCGDCGGKLYIQDFTPQGKPYTYYRCKDCNIRLPRKKVDKTTWDAYAETVTNPQALKQAIVEEDFITNKNTSDLKALRDSCEKRLVEITEECRRFNYAWIRGRMDQEQYEQLGLEIEKEKLKVEADLRRAVNTLILPDKREEAIRRASAELAEIVESVQLLKKIGEVPEGYSVPEPKAEYLAKVEEIVRKSPPADLANGKVPDIFQVIKLMDNHIDKLRAMSKRLPLPDDIRDAGFKIARQLLDDLVLAGGKISVNHQGVVIHGVIRLGEDNFKQKIIGTTSFG